MSPPLLTLQDVSLTFGAAPLLSAAALSVGARDRICLVGRNGSGKSTLLKVAAGLLPPDSGRRFAQPGATIRYLPQEPDFSGFTSTLAYVEAGFEGTSNPHRATYLLEQLGLDGTEDPARLSGGEARRAALARVLAPEPDVLLLDEPTNHLDLPGIEWLEQELSSLRSGIVLISHDRRLLESLSRSTVWLDRGLTRSIDQGFAHFEAWRDSVLEQEETERHKLGRKIAMEEDWLRYGVTARRKRNVRRLGELHSLRKRHREQRAAVGKVRMDAAEADLSGRLVIVAEAVSKSYGDRVVVRDLSTRVLRGDRIGIVGPNGAGKTTLLNLMTGELTPDQGEVALGANLAAITLDQRRETLDPAQTLKQALTGGAGDTVTVGGQNRHVVGYMKDFLFGPEQANTPVGVLSGGEKGRLTLARAFARPSNLLVLDEPTNDLDLETLDLLQERLADYTGTVLLVSHDRDFLDRVVTATVATEGDGRWIEYAGGYTDMLLQRRAGTAGAGTARAAGGKALDGKAGDGKAGSGKNRGSAPGASVNRGNGVSNGSSPGSSEPDRSAASPAGSAAPATGAQPKRKMSFKDRHALETLPGRIASLQQETGRLGSVLADPDLYARDAVKYQRASQALEASQAALTEAEEQWLALEMLREELEG